ncbi:UDP-3-O-(3-hydroxymyristoyl)glucosamine N-acyltransferase [Nitrospirillum viridazoti]|uniref:UDP-3-O-acylglucosamine N-acyltransferase n=1 Tax=Nitrospirillum viridazoti CBAmc TaxID=1441467 RepID=A0A248JQL6_9PROT|nr:UDP-3-O-(3-hydroxymyristoyl)glucosamine N-acyltransferase [Nitrospirillum amazonense]ASG20771.1 UDP-3-O-(3-hydroxymyristoyl)glucosamine N-acyltransferase [Nitrospirillum amazonense CBAmc]TWB37899.1 UDP-3-O-[3-hydroxymyristoyl] glucosamine N-acyltransferase [Nitrospirillum amazonense]
MADPRFFNRAGPYTLAELARRSGAEVAPGSDPDLVLSDVAALDAAEPGQLSFLDNKKYVAAFSATRAGAVVVHPALASKAPAGVALLLSRNPYKAYALCAQAFYPATAPSGKISAGAHVDPGAEVGEGTDIAAGAVVEAGAVIGARCRIGPNATIGVNVRLGDDTVIGANASLTHCILGARVTIYPGARIGQDGFGFAMDLAGHVRVPQMGRVVIEDDVEIGANATVDRGAGPDTVIGRGCMIDNLVQIGHNVHLGAGCVIVAQAGISGSTKLDHHVVLAAQAGVTGHLKIGAGAQIAAQSGVMRDVGPGEKVGGSPAVPMRQWLRQVAALGRLVRGRNEGDGRDD